MSNLTKELPDILQAKHIQGYLGISQALTYNLMNSKGFPTIKINTRMVVSKDAFMKWLEDSAGQQINVKKAI